MSRILQVCLIAAISVMILGCAACYAADDQISGLVLGRTGELLDIRMDQPVKEGTVFNIKVILSDPPIAEARAVSCTNEWPYVVLAKVIAADFQTSVPIGARAFADVRSVDLPNGPKPIKNDPPDDGERISVQLGSFYPTMKSVRESVSSYWPSCRLNYSFLKLKGFECTLSGEYMRGSGESDSIEGRVSRTMEVIPAVALAKIRLFKIGGTSLVAGAGGGYYRIKSERMIGGFGSTDTIDKLGTEYSLGLQSRHNWVMELRYRDVPDTEIKGYGLTLGAKY